MHIQYMYIVKALTFFVNCAKSAIQIPFQINAGPVMFPATVSEDCLFSALV